MLVGRRLRPVTGEAGVGFVDESIDITVDAPVAYSVWLDYEDYPRFMPGIDDVAVTGYCRLRWRGRVGGEELEWDTDVVAHVQDTRVRWEATDGRETVEVTFEKLDAGTTRVHYQLEYEPARWGGDPGAVRASLRTRVRGGLRAFKALVEAPEDVDEGPT
jgi:uncharacterized membrane protein